MARVIPDEPGEDVPAALADVIERRRKWPTSMEIFAAICDAVDNHGHGVAWAAEQLGLKREQVYRDYWSKFRAEYETLVADGVEPEKAIEIMTAERADAS